MSKQELCWLDCDPGTDDAFAIVLAAYSERIKLIGISSVVGNQTIEKTTNNVLKVMNLAGLITQPTLSRNCIDLSQQLKLEDSMSHGGMACPVLKGCSRPLFRDAIIFDMIFGDSGLDTHSSIEFPKIPDTALDYFNNINSHPTHFTTLMFDYFKSFYPKKITIIAIGPLTNIALLLMNHPGVSDYIERIVLMGGAMGLGNTTPASEFNIFGDPHAATRVFNSNLEIFMVPLEITHTTLVTESVLDRIRTLKSNFSKIMIEFLLFFQSTVKEFSNMADPPLHDPCAVAFVIDSSMFEYKLIRVDVETNDTLSLGRIGRTICDVCDTSKKTKNVNVCLKINVDKFWSLMVEALEK
ncbi:unnamed protein product, partial [Sphagnum jensenii]